MLEKWRKMSPGDRLKVQVIIVFLIIGLYGMLLYPHSFKKYFEAKKMVSRRANRIEVRTDTDVKAPTVDPKIINRKAEETDEKLREIKESFNELDTGFAPLDSSDMRQQLLLEISNLARRTGVTLTSVVRKGLEGKGGAELLGRGQQQHEGGSAQVALDPTLGRPLLVVRAVGQYQPLIAFLRGLKELSFYVSPMQVRLYASHLKGSGTGGSAAASPAGPDDGTLNVFLELSM